MGTYAGKYRAVWRGGAKHAMWIWPHLTETELLVLNYSLRMETARSDVIARALGYTPAYVRQVFVALRGAFGVHENAALLLRADRISRQTYKR